MYGEKLLSSIALPNVELHGGSPAQDVRRSEVNIDFPIHIPVYLTYQTAYVDDAGKLVIRADVYGRDAGCSRSKGDDRRVADIGVERRPTGSGISRDAFRYNVPGSGGDFSNPFASWFAPALVAAVGTAGTAAPSRPPREPRFGARRAELYREAFPLIHRDMAKFEPPVNQPVSGRFVFRRITTPWPLFAILAPYQNRISRRGGDNPALTVHGNTALGIFPAARPRPALLNATHGKKRASSDRTQG